MAGADETSSSEILETSSRSAYVLSVRQAVSRWLAVGLFQRDRRCLEGTFELRDRRGNSP